MDENRYAELKVDNQICFPLYACSRELIKLYKPCLDRMGLTYTQYITMLALWENGTMTVKQLGEKLFLDSGTLTPLLKKLEQKGLITRKRSLEDERNLIVAATQEGLALRDAALEVSGEMRTCTGITGEEELILRNVLTRLLQQAGEEKAEQ